MDELITLFGGMSSNQAYIVRNHLSNMREAIRTSNSALYYAEGDLFEASLTYLSSSEKTVINDWLATKGITERL